MMRRVTLFAVGLGWFAGFFGLGVLLAPVIRKLFST